jgi:hypothetical protein
MLQEEARSPSSNKWFRAFYWVLGIYAGFQLFLALVLRVPLFRMQLDRCSNLYIVQFVKWVHQVKRKNTHTHTHTHTDTHSKSPYYFLRNLLIGSSWGECKWKHLVWKEHIEISFLYYFLVKVTIFFMGIWFDVQFQCVGTLLCWAWHVREHSWLLHVNPDLFHLALLLHGFFVFWLMAKNSFLSCISWLISAGE